MWELAHQPAVITSDGARERHFEAIVQMLDEGVVVFRADGSPKYINPAAMQICALAERDATEFFEHAATSPWYYGDGTRMPAELCPLAFGTSVMFTREIYGVELPGGE